MGARLVWMPGLSASNHLRTAHYYDLAGKLGMLRPEGLSVRLDLTGRDLVGVTINSWPTAKMPSDLFTWYFTEAPKECDHCKSYVNR